MTKQEFNKIKKYSLELIKISKSHDHIIVKQRQHGTKQILTHIDAEMFNDCILFFFDNNNYDSGMGYFDEIYADEEYKDAINYFNKLNKCDLKYHSLDFEKENRKGDK